MDKAMMSQFKITDRQKVMGKFMAIALLGAVVLVGYYYILPYLLSIVWGTIQLALGIGIAAILLWILCSKKFWLGLELLGSAIGKVLFGWVVELDPFNVLEMKVNQAEKDRQDLYNETEKLKGQEAELENQINQNNQEMTLAAKKMDILKQKISKDPTDDDSKMTLEKVSTDFSLAKDFIDGIKPIYNDIKKLVTMADKAYQKSGVDIEISRNTIKKQKALYRAVTTANNAFGKAMRAFTGKKELNDAAEVALDKLRQDVGFKIGRIKSSIQVTSQFMNQRDLTDAAKVSMAVDTLQKLDAEPNFDYAGTIQSSTLNSTDANFNSTQSGNKYLDMLKK